MEKEKLKMSKCFIALLWLLALLFGCMACAESIDVISRTMALKPRSRPKGFVGRITMGKSSALS